MLCFLSWVTELEIRWVWRSHLLSSGRISFRLKQDWFSLFTNFLMTHWVLKKRWQNTLTRVWRDLWWSVIGNTPQILSFWVCWVQLLCLELFIAWKQGETQSSDLSKGNKSISEALWHIAFHSFNPYNNRWKTHAVGFSPGCVQLLP